MYAAGTFSITCVVHNKDSWLSGYCSSVAEHCGCTGQVSWFDFWWLPAFSLCSKISVCVMLFTMLKDDFHDILSSTGLTPTVSSRWLTLASLKVLTPKATSGRRRVKLSSFRWNGFLQKLWLKASSQRNLMWWVLWYRVPLSITLPSTPWTVYPPPSSSSPPLSASPSPAWGRSFDQFCHDTQFQHAFLKDQLPILCKTAPTSP